MSTIPRLPPCNQPGRIAGFTRGCLITGVALVVLIPLLALGTIWWLAHLYEKSPKQPGEAEFLDVCTIQIASYRGKEGMGNTLEAEGMARTFARNLRLGRHVFFTEGSKALLDLTQGYFLTHCSVVSNRCAFVVQVPQLRHYSAEAKVSLGELAWSLATQQVLASTNLIASELAVVIRGQFGTDRILLGRIRAGAKPWENVRQGGPGYIKEEELYPFFDWPKPSVAGPGAPDLVRPRMIIKSESKKRRPRRTGHA